MEHKAWIWRRKSLEKTITTNEKTDISLAQNEKEKEKTLELERSLEDLKEQLSSVLCESNAKDGLLAKQKKVAEEAIAGWEKAETEAESLEKELADAVLQKAAAEERIASIGATLRECMQQLHVVRDEHQHSINDAATKMSRLQQKVRALEKSLEEKNDSLVKLGVEHSNMSRTLEVQEKMIEDLTKSKSQAELSCTALVARLDASEKDNASLMYEVCMLQKEIDIRNQDRDFHLKSADAANKQNLASARKIAKLESECQRLRLMVRKRLPGPAAVAKMRSEIEVLGDSTLDVMRKKPMLAPVTMMSRDFSPGSDCDSSSKKVASLIERLHAVEDENKILKDTLVKKNNELQLSRIMFARIASKLSQAEAQHEEFWKRGISLELTRSSFSNDLPLALISEGGGNEDTISSAESWASALISELEQFRNSKTTTTTPTTTAGVSELSLMDDFIEMEKLAVGFVDERSGERTPSLTPKGIDSELVSSNSTGKEMVPINTLSNPSGTNNGLQALYKSFDKHPIWLQEILWVVMQKHHSMNKSLDVILNEVSAALGLQHISSNSLDSTSILPNETNKQQFRPDLEKPLCKVIELIEGIIQRSFTSNIARQMLSGECGSTAVQHRSFSPSRHDIFQWEVSELCAVLQHFTVVCNDMLHGKVAFKEFTYELASTLEWLINHCFPLYDASSNSEESIKKAFSLNESHGDSEFKAVTRTMMELEDLKSRNAYTSSLSTMSNGLCKSQVAETESKLKDENKRLRLVIRDTASSKKDLEKRLESANAKNYALSTQLKESDESISNLQAELMTLKYSNTSIEDQIENQKLITEDLGTQLTVVNAELSEARQKFSSLEVELEDKSNHCEEMEATCLELQLQLESVATKEAPRHDKRQEERQLRSDLEIAAASEKLAECQATILNLGKQLKALAAPNDAALFDKVISPTPATRINHCRQLVEQMQAEDEATSKHLRSPKTKEIICTEIEQPLSFSKSVNNPNVGLLYGWKLHANAGQSASSATVGIEQPSYVQDDFNKKRGENDAGRLVLIRKGQNGGSSFLKKLLSRIKKGEQ